MRKKYFEASVGIFIIIGVICLIFLTFKVSGNSLSSLNAETYNITADFKDVGSLRTNATVKISGVEIGKVTDIKLKDSYNGFVATVTMSLNKKEKIPANYSASIEMSGILGDNYISLSPSNQDVLAIAGIEDENKDKFLQEGSHIDLENTESAINLSSLINTVVASSDEKKEDK